MIHTHLCQWSCTIHRHFSLVIQIGWKIHFDNSDNAIRRENSIQYKWHLICVSVLFYSKTSDLHAQLNSPASMCLVYIYHFPISLGTLPTCQSCIPWASGTFSLAWASGRLLICAQTLKTDPFIPFIDRSSVDIVNPGFIHWTIRRFSTRSRLNLTSWDMGSDLFDRVVFLHEPRWQLAVTGNRLIKTHIWRLDYCEMAKRLIG